MESEISAEDSSAYRAAASYLDDFDWSGETTERIDTARDDLAVVIQQAEERGYQRGKAEQVVLRTQSQHGFLSSATDLKTQIQTDRCVCGAVFSCDMFVVNEALNDHVRQAWAEQSAPCEWEDLKGLEGRELRERLKSRAHIWIQAERAVGNIQSASQVNMFYHDREDLQIIIDLINSRVNSCQVEAARLWDQHLSDLATWYIEEDPSYLVLLERVNNIPAYAHIVVERAAARRMREESRPIVEGEQVVS